MSKIVYDEAIAEAKLLRETAEQNAKNAIIEAVTPRIREFIEEQLLDSSVSNDSKEVLDDIISETFSIEDVENDVILDETALEKLLEIFGSKSDSALNRSDFKNVIKKSLDSLSEEQKINLGSAADKIGQNIDLFESSRINNDIHIKQESSSMSAKDDMLYEIDLDELASALTDDEDIDGTADEADEAMELEEALRSLGLLNEDVLEIDLGETEVPEDLVDALSRAAITIRSEEGDDEDVEAAGEEEDEGEGEEEEIDIDAMMSPEEDEAPVEESLDEFIEIDEAVLRSELSRLRAHLAEAKELTKIKGIKDAKESTWGGSGSGKAGVKGAYGGTGGSKSGVKGAFGGGKESGDPLKVTLNKLSEAFKKERRKNRSLSSKLNEYRSAVETLREQLTDLNLFNAKLLYVNKLMQRKDLTTGQRKSIVESIDNAKSLREVKLLYKSLTQSTISGGGRLSESTTRRAIGSSSRATGRASAGSAETEVNRWAILAGISK